MIDEVVLEPQKVTVQIAGNDFVLIEPMADELARYARLQKEIARKVVEISGDLGRLFDELAKLAQEEDSEDKTKKLEALNKVILEKEDFARSKIDDSEVILCILRTCPTNPKVDEAFIKTNLSASMRRKLVDKMNKICDLDTESKNVMGLLFPNVSFLTSKGSST